MRSAEGALTAVSLFWAVQSASILPFFPKGKNSQYKDMLWLSPESWLLTSHNVLENRLSVLVASHTVHS